MVLIHMSKDPQVDPPHPGLFPKEICRPSEFGKIQVRELVVDFIEAGLWNRRALARLFYVDLHHFKRLCPQRS
jgi:hypothetical protein